jgi:hypothetical protein
MPHERLSELSHGLRELRITAPPRMNCFRMGDAQTIRYLRCADEILHVNLPAHGDELYDADSLDYSLSQLAQSSEGSGGVMKLVAYLRVSTDVQAEGLGLAVQRAAITEWARTQAHEIAAEFTDAGLSGSKG